jgi:hypothetical protein
MNPNLNWITRLMSFMAFPIGEGGGGVDRGDDFTPTDDDAGDTAVKEALAAKAAEDAAALAALEAKKKAEEGKTAEELAAEAEAEAEAAAAEAAKGGKDKGKDTRMPLSRHKEILDRERAGREAAERELALLKQGQAVAKTNEDLTAAETKVIEAEAEYLKLLEKGDVKGAAAKMAEVRTLERSIIQGRAQFDLQAAEARAYERVKYDMTVERLEAAFPIMNPDHEDHDPAKTAEVVELRDAYIATRKYTRAEALQKAVSVLLKPATAKQTAATEVDVRVGKEDLAAATAAERKAAAVAKALAAQKGQPANAAGVGADSDKAGGKLKGADVIKMDQKSFAKLADEDLKKLRGDDLE